MRSEVLDYVAFHIAPLSDPTSTRSSCTTCVCEGRLWYATNSSIAVEGDCGIDEDNTGVYRATDLTAAAHLGQPVTVEKLPEAEGFSPSTYRALIHRKVRKPRRSSHDVATLLERCDRYPEHISVDDLLRRPTPHELDCGTYLDPSHVRTLLEASPEPRLSVQRAQPLQPVRFVGTNWRAAIMPVRRSEPL